MGILDWFRKQPRPLTPVPVKWRRDDRGDPFVRVEIARHRGLLAPTASKLGGVPYVPEGTEPPGEPMMFLAQIDLAEVPAIGALPRAGLVQLWIIDDDTYGLCDSYGNLRTDGFRCIYYPSCDTPQRADIRAPGERGPLETSENCALRFIACSEPKPGDESGHKIGGSCDFIQDDPREPDDPMWSLLQLDAHVGCVAFADPGIAHWFIRETDLRAGDFSRVMYYWDC